VSLCYYSYITLRIVSVSTFLLLLSILKQWYFVHTILITDTFSFIYILVKSYRSLRALILPVIFIYFVIFCTQSSCFYSKRLRHWMAFYLLMCR